MSFLCSRIPQKVYWFAIISWFTSLNRIFIWLSNDSKLGYILPIPYYVFVKKTGAVRNRTLEVLSNLKGDKQRKSRKQCYLLISAFNYSVNMLTSKLTSVFNTYSLYSHMFTHITCGAACVKLWSKNTLFVSQ